MDHQSLEETIQHSKRVASLCLLLGEKAGDIDLAMLLVCALLHDVGKSAVPDELLSKPGKLTPEEFEQVKTHAKLGAEQIQEMIERLKEASVTAMQHHERYGDRNGYIGLKGEEIHPIARIVGLCDVADALMSRRPYKAPWKLDDMLEYVRENTGTQFDPYWAELLLGCEDELREIYCDEESK